MMVKLHLIIVVAFFVSSLTCQIQNDLLPMTSQPVAYFVIISSNVPARSFNGTLSVTIRVLVDTNEIHLHSRGHTINELQMFQNNIELPGTISHSRDDDNDVIKITSTQELKAGLFYNVLINYHGNLLLSSDGFFRSAYVVPGDDGSDTFT